MLSRLPFHFAALHAAYADGLAVEDVVAETYRRIAEADDPGIFIHLFDRAGVVEAARALGPFDPQAGPLWGLPFVIKDNIDAAGAPTTAACPAFAYTAAEDAFVVALLKQAGALLVGKTNLDQFATGLVGVRSPYPPPKNAIDPTVVPGGSSSGSAVAVSRGIVSFALGTDTAGSGRVPAALNNIVGLKPTLGAVSARGVVPACRTLDTVSVFALTVEDAFRVFRLTSVYDAGDAYARPVPAPPLGRPSPHFTVGVPTPATRDFRGDAAQAASFEAALSLIEAEGGDIVELDFSPFYAVADRLYSGAWVAERYTVVEHLLKADPEAVFPVTRTVISSAERFTAADAFRDFYGVAELKRQIEPIIASVDMLGVPSIPAFYTVADLQKDPIGPNNSLGTYTNFVNLLDLCAIAVPVAARLDGRPGSVTLIAPAGRDAVIAALAGRLHEASGASLGATGWKLPPCSSTDESAEEEIRLVVAGAHMSGLPLNGELTKLGARFLRACKTADNYRLYSLSGGPPYRPGLMRDDSGSALDVEVWAVPSDKIGLFLSGIPAPLGLGTVVLEDGSSEKGFICEAAGLEGARDITEYGGWRAFLQSASGEPRKI